MTPGTSKGEWVEPATIPPPKADPPERHSSTWVMSSFDLQYGADISDVSDTVPEALLDELFPPRNDSPKTSRK